jgi:hypothetical protein
MKKIIILSIILFGGLTFTKAQTTIHGQAEPVELIDLIDGSFYKIITSDIWVYADGSYGINSPYTLQLTTAPVMDGTVIGDFKPIPCYTAKSDYGASKVKCGPYHVRVVDDVYIRECKNTNDVTCQIKWNDSNGDHVVWNPEIG